MDGKSFKIFHDGLLKAIKAGSSATSKVIGRGTSFDEQSNSVQSNAEIQSRAI
jgi:hypothetical protein